MTKLPTSVAFGVLLVLGGCGGRAIGHGDSSTSGAAATTTTSSSGAGQSSGADESSTVADAAGSTGEPVVCEEGLTNCDGLCVDLLGSTDNCGECGRECFGEGSSGACSMGLLCTPGLYPCILPESGVQTCDEACATIGRDCVEKGEELSMPCGGVAAYYLSDLQGDPSEGLEQCASLGNGAVLSELECGAPLEWATLFSGKEVVGVACCCSQDFQ